VPLGLTADVFLVNAGATFPFKGWRIVKGLVVGDSRGGRDSGQH
jgi:hypothetical protein